jgi:hypothetical protein
MYIEPEADGENVTNNAVKLEFCCSEQMEVKRHCISSHPDIVAEERGVPALGHAA